MKKLLLCLMLLATIQSNGQAKYGLLSYETHSGGDTVSVTRWAPIKKDTVYIHDTVYVQKKLPLVSLGTVSGSKIFNQGSRFAISYSVCGMCKKDMDMWRKMAHDRDDWVSELKYMLALIQPEGFVLNKDLKKFHSLLRKYDSCVKIKTIPFQVAYIGKDKKPYAIIKQP